MTLEEIYVTYEELKKEGYSKEKLFCATCTMFIEDKLKFNELYDALRVLGYKISDELKNYDKERQKQMIAGYVKSFAQQYEIEEFM